MHRILIVTALTLGACSSDAAPPPAPGVDPTTLPLLAAGPHVGIIYSRVNPAAEPALDVAFGECISRGMSTYQLAISWNAFESSPGVIDLTFARSLFAATQAAGITPYLVIKTIDTVTLNAPSDLLDPNDGSRLAAGLTFDHPAVLDRFGAVLDQLVPELVAAGGFYLSVGNEVNNYLESRPSDIAAFAAFVDRARQRAQAIEPRLAVGTSCSFEAVNDTAGVLTAMKAVSDIVAFTYYPIDGGFMALDPAAVTADFDAMLQAVSPGPLMLQEVGYPAGWTAGPTNGGSLEKQRQFVANVFTAIQAEPRIRFVSLLHLSDYGTADLDLFETYYGVAAPTFREYLGTLGIREWDGTAKPAYAEFLTGLSR